MTYDDNYVRKVSIVFIGEDADSESTLLKDLEKYLKRRAKALNIKVKGFESETDKEYDVYGFGDNSSVHKEIKQKRD